MIEGNKRFIIVMGMAHSGTTIFAKTLALCPSFVLCTHGRQSWLLEHDAILSRRTAQVAALLKRHTKKRVLLKKPWCEKNGQWFYEQMPNAYYFCLLKSKEDSMKSWSKPGSYVNTEFRKNPELQSRQYDDFAKFATEFPCKNCMVIKYGRLVKHAPKVFQEAAEFLGVDFKFDTSEIGVNKNVKRSLKKKNNAKN
jgi:hypothetical protein